MSIKIDNITKIYGNQKALDQVSFEIKTGEIVGFLGPNGAGKSTMMKIITGFIAANSGDVYINDLNIKDSNIEVKKKIGYLPELNPLYYNMYVKEYLGFTAGLYQIKNKQLKINELIELTGLSKEQHKKIEALSKGYKQRVGLAQALIHDPEVLILDEPTSGLDPNQIIEIRNLIANVGAKKTVMLSTHIMQEVEAICQRIIIINNGKIIADNTTDNIKQQSDQKYQTIIVEFNKDPEQNELKSITGVMQVMKAENNSWLIQCSLGKDLREDIFNFAVQNDLKVLSMLKKEKSLEEVFQELTSNQ